MSKGVRKIFLPAGQTSLFYQGKAGLGLTAALRAVKHSFVFVGNMPTSDGTSATVQAGSILVLDRNGELDGTLTDPKLINGPNNGGAFGIGLVNVGGAVRFAAVDDTE